jgi:hypothetical protein
MTARRTVPTKSLLQGAAYVHSTQTDIKARFDAIRAAQQTAPANVMTIQRKVKK